MKYSYYDDKVKKEIYSSYNVLCGVDEVGRGPLAGPVLACACIMPKDVIVEGVTDSKKISKKKLKLLSQSIKNMAIDYAFGMENNKTIDLINIKQATLSAMKKAVSNLKIKPDILLIDAEQIDIPIKQLNIAKGDLLEYQISCASILAKVKRDEIMNKFDSIYPNYGFSTNAGYGTKKHYKGIDEFGITPIHRKSFLKKYFISRNNMQTGRLGEELACDVLKKKGYEIVERNFRSNYGEIDIIAKKQDEIYFIEVKTRKNAVRAYACEAVDFRKQDRIIKTSEYFLQVNNLMEKTVHFDVFEIYVEDKKYKYIKDCF